MLGRPAIEMQSHAPAEPAGSSHSHHGQRHQRDYTPELPDLPRNQIMDTEQTQLSSESSAHIAPGNSSPHQRAVVERLAHKLSRQNLQLESDSFVQPQPQYQLQPQVQLQLPSAPRSVAPSSNTSPFPSFIEVDDQLLPSYYYGSMDLPSLDTLPLGTLPFSRPAAPYSLAVEPPKVDSARPDTRRLRRQTSGQLQSSLIDTPAMQDRVEEMIASGSQCNVHSAPVVIPAKPSVLNTVIEPDPTVCIPPVLEVDEAYCNGAIDIEAEEKAFMESYMSVRRAGLPGRVRKHTIAGIPLRYQLSQDVADCSKNGYRRNKPRMRKRKKTTTSRPESAASGGTSGVTSAFSSPVIPPSLPSPSPIPLEHDAS